MSIKALQKAIKFSGGQAALADKLGKKQGHISMWIRRDKVPAEMVLKIEKVSNVPRHELRPDLYPPEEYGFLSDGTDQKQAA
ncbi:YdaS family helix-turn-helix protein [Pseudoalteromonas sp. MEBiC 03485]|uniref:transcriptional regulator n=1 Tax=Pseudoalteromonas sp. MEBiC 03485 TaxID=2571103 RepID=UPI001021EF27|nr:YdaS family helix-turn-helix protein [Pseudoalteromonas sp. MEBiC 03485]RZD22377.1 helix-turn-helix domain-containing protein [Pseudoalteromonas sp. MEBiC 03485]